MFYENTDKTELKFSHDSQQQTLVVLPLRDGPPAWPWRPSSPRSSYRRRCLSSPPACSYHWLIAAGFRRSWSAAGQRDSAAAQHSGCSCRRNPASPLASQIWGRERVTVNFQ